jgi:HrpA-like RNA helicase
VLVFLPGQEDIEGLEQLLREHLEAAIGAGNHAAGAEEGQGMRGREPDAVIMPLYAAMPQEEQLKVFRPASPGKRKFVLSTNIAETSLTISGIRYGE